MLGFAPIASQPVGDVTTVTKVEPYVVSASGRAVGRSVVSATGRLVYSSSVNDKITVSLLPGLNINLIDSSLNIRLY